MAIKNILIAYNGGEASDSAVRLALQMCAKYDAHLTGILAHGASDVAKKIPYWIASSMRETMEKLTEERMIELKGKFFTMCDKNISPDRLHWIDVKSQPDKAVSYYSRYFDIIVLGQYENLLESDELTLRPHNITRESRRPIIVAPKNYTATSLNERAVVVWDGRKRSSRSFFDAMQMLETKKEVYILHIGTAMENTHSSEANLVTVLERHGVKAEQHTLTLTRSIDTKILDFCRQVDAGLLIMGSYPSSRLSEDLFGGFNVSILDRTHIPLFLSH